MEEKMLSDTDLLNNKFGYTIEELENSVDNLSVTNLLYYQKLTAVFCAIYILNDYCATCVEDTYYCTNDVLRLQKHITLVELREACKQFKTFESNP
jgi:hypothetical protein